MSSEELKGFLQDYVEVLTQEFPWREIAPVSTRSDMPRGVVEVVDREGEVIAYFFTKGTTCSMPISPRDVSGAKLLTASINYLAECEKGYNNDG